MSKQTTRQIRETTRNKVIKEYSRELEFWKSSIQGVQRENKELEEENKKLKTELQTLREEFQELKDINGLLQESMNLSEEDIQMLIDSKKETFEGLESILKIYKGLF